MRAGGEPRRTDVGNGIALFDFIAFFGNFGKAANVPITGGIVVGVAHFHVIAKAALLADKCNNTVGYGLDRGACGGCIINAQMRAADA